MKWLVKDFEVFKEIRWYLQLKGFKPFKGQQSVLLDAQSMVVDDLISADMFIFQSTGIGFPTYTLEFIGNVDKANEIISEYLNTLQIGAKDALINLDCLCSIYQGLNK